MSKNRNSLLKGKSSNRNLGLAGVSKNDEAIAKSEKKFAVSFEYLDVNQGQTFEEWADEGLLINMLNTLKEYCKKTMQENKGPNFKEYGSFPTKTDFKHPKHVPKDVSWASLHIAGKPCLGGHIVENVFYVVFLDKDHRFWICEKKHT